VKPRRLMTLEERLTVQEAIEDVRGLFSRYTWALDNGDLDGIVACFTDDGVFEFQSARWAGAPAVRHYFEEDRKKHTDMVHFPVNVVVDVTELDTTPDGSGRAEARAVLWDLFNRARGAASEGACLAGYYRLSARRTRGEWKIGSLEVIAKWVVPVPEWRMSEDFEVRPELRS
jgi:ketosteroid isomerase-like protein